MKTTLRLLALAAASLAAAWIETADAQVVPAALPALREAQVGEVWITQPTLVGAPGVTPQSGSSAVLQKVYGEAGNQISWSIAPAGIGADGTPAASWPPEKAAALGSFMDQMLPVLRDLYGPPATSYTVRLVRDLRYTASAVFIPSSDEIHAGDNVSYQLITHELVHAFRRDRNLSSGPQWQFDPTLSGFEEGFAQAVSYEAMTEFARRTPSFGLAQRVYQSSNEWDYDFQNVPELRTRDFWSDSGGMLLYWTRYEMAAAAIEKIEREHPGFHRAFNAEYFRRLNADPGLTPSRDLVKDIVRTVAPTIEGRPAALWIDRQYIFDCADHPGKKIWLSTQHYPAPADYFIFNRVFFYETFPNGSDWATPNGAGGYDYYHLNGASGTAALHAGNGSVVWQSALRITPTENPPAFFGFGNENVDLTTQATNLPWPGGDPSRFATGLLPFDLYRLNVQFTSGTTVASDSWRVIGEPLRSASGIFGGIVGATGGTITLKHRSHPAEPPVAVVNGVFLATPSWASQPHPETGSVDTDPGVVDVTYVNAAGDTFTDVRVIGYGSAHGNQAFLFDVSRMAAFPLQKPVSIVSQPSSRTATAGQSVQFVVAATGTPAPAYQWQISTDAGSSWTNVADGASYGGAQKTVLTLAGVTLAMNAGRYRAVATNALGSAVSATAALRRVAVRAGSHVLPSAHSLPRLRQPQRQRARRRRAGPRRRNLPRPPARGAMRHPADRGRPVGQRDGRRTGGLRFPGSLPRRPARPRRQHGFVPDGTHACEQRDRQDRGRRERHAGSFKRRGRSRPVHRRRQRVLRVTTAAPARPSGAAGRASNG